MKGAACELCVSTQECSAPWEAIRPLVASEDVCLTGAAVAISRRLYTTSESDRLLETAVRLGDEDGDGVEALTKAQRILERVTERSDSLTESRVDSAKLLAYLPITEARMQRRFPTGDEVSEVRETLFGWIPEWRQACALTPEEYFDLRTGPNDDQPHPGMQVAFLGKVAEAVTLYLSLQDGQTLLVPSSGRQDSSFPGLESKSEAHDAHTYHPDNPADRVLIEIKAQRLRKSHGRPTVEYFNLLGAATQVYNEQTGASLSLPYRVGKASHYDGLEMADILSWLIEAEAGPDSGTTELERTFSQEFRGRLCGKLEEVIEAGWEKRRASPNAPTNP